VLPDYSEGIQIQTEDADPRFNNALARGLAVLRAFQVDRKLLGNLELAQITGLSKPTVSRLTYTLTRLGYLRHREAVGQYELAAGVVGLAYPYLANQAIPPVARPLMLQMALDSGTNVGLGVQEDFSVLYLEYALGEVNPNRLQRVGFRVPLVRTSMGRACIAGMQPDARQRLFEHLQAYYQREWAVLRPQLDAAVNQVRQQGWCVAAGTFNTNTNSVAVPLTGLDGECVMALNSQAHAKVQTSRAMARNGQMLLDMAHSIRARLLPTASDSPRAST
jgi:DNA-binding IclR family transcriptional regulator